MVTDKKLTLIGMELIDIKRVGPTDLEELQNIGRQTFTETFAEINTPENMLKYLEDSFSAEQLAREIEDPDSEFYFATLGNRAIGYLKVNKGQAQTELKDENTLELERIYVLAEFHRKKVGQILFDKALKTAQNLKVEYLWLGVWENNTRAINFYRKNGFAEFGKHDFWLGNDQQTDIMMRLKING